MRCPAKCSRPMLGRALFCRYCRWPRPTACVMARFERRLWPPGGGVAIMLIGRVARGSCWGHRRLSFGLLWGRGVGASVWRGCARRRGAPFHPDPWLPVGPGAGEAQRTLPGPVWPGALCRHPPHGPNGGPGAPGTDGRGHPQDGRHLPRLVRRPGRGPIPGRPRLLLERQP